MVLFTDFLLPNDQNTLNQSRFEVWIVPYSSKPHVSLMTSTCYMCHTEVEGGAAACCKNGLRNRTQSNYSNLFLYIHTLAITCVCVCVSVSTLWMITVLHHASHSLLL